MLGNTKFNPSFVEDEIYSIMDDYAVGSDSDMTEPADLLKFHTFNRLRSVNGVAVIPRGKTKQGSKTLGEQICLTLTVCIDSKMRKFKSED